MARVLQLNDGRFLLGEQTFELDGVLEHFRTSAGVVVELVGGGVFVAWRRGDLVGLRVERLLQIGACAEPELVREARFRRRLAVTVPPEENP